MLEPAADSAKDYLAELQKLPSDPKRLSVAATAMLQQAYVVKIREAAGQSRREDMKRWVAEARALDVAPARLDAAMRAAPPAPAAPVGQRTGHATRADGAGSSQGRAAARTVTGQRGGSLERAACRGSVR